MKQFFLLPNNFILVYKRNSSEKSVENQLPLLDALFSDGHSLSQEFYLCKTTFLLRAQGNIRESKKQVFNNFY
jgi:hypothetical protein